VFTATSGEGLTGYDHGSCIDGGHNGNVCAEFYVYSADTNHLACVTCNPSGAPATAEPEIGVRAGTGAAGTSTHLNHAIVDDGSRVFFSTAEALVQSDVNGKVDVYQYDVADGTVHLISSGRSTSNSYFMDATADGGNVFFLTRDALVGWDTDGSEDLYDARVDGGFPGPSAPPPACSGDVCQGSLSGVPNSITFASNTIAATGNLKPVSNKVVTRLSNIQKLSKALSACRKKRSKSQRRRCESQARKRYAKKASKSRGSK
jgi:hypothetical protein